MVPHGEVSRALRGRSLGRDIGWALLIKSVALVLLYFAFFGPSHRVEMTADRVAGALIDPAQHSTRP